MKKSYPMSTHHLSRRELLKSRQVAGTVSSGESLMSLSALASPVAPLEVADHRRYATIHGARMAYLEVGEGDPIVFLHGQATSSYLWRKIIPYVKDMGRCVAPDLIGMGRSGKLDPTIGPDRYRFIEHRRYLDALLTELNVSQNVTLVVHDWGGPLGLDWASRRPQTVMALAYMETMLRPFQMDKLQGFKKPFFKWTRSFDIEQEILTKGGFVEDNIECLADLLSEEDKAEYRKPYLTKGEAWRPVATWPREIPIDGEPADVHEVFEAFSDWLIGVDIPKLLISADPGALITHDELDFARSLENQTEVCVHGFHQLPEEAPEFIGRSLARWLRRAVKKVS